MVWTPSLTITKFYVLQVNADEKASLIFQDLDVDGNGTVDEEEFIRYVKCNGPMSI